MGGGSWVEVGAMLGATLQGLLARRGRLVLTAVAVLAGVALVTGTLMLTDAVGRSVRHLTAGAPGVVAVSPVVVGRRRRWSAGTTGRSTTGAPRTWS
jgi:hypothetical protein